MRPWLLPFSENGLVANGVAARNSNENAKKGLQYEDASATEVMNNFNNYKYPKHILDYVKLN